MELAFWVGAAGASLSPGSWSVGLTVVAAYFGLPMAYPTEWIVAVVTQC